MTDAPRTDRNHFRFLNEAAREVGSWLRLVRKRSPALYTVLRIIFFLLLGIASYLVEQVCEGGWTVMLLLALFGILLFLAVFAFDYASAQRINYQFFWKPWILILMLILYIMFLGFRSGYQKIQSADLLTKTNVLYSDVIGNLKTEIADTNSYFVGEFNNLKGQLADAKHDRDHYQEMLAPFEAYALAKYTNAPIDERLELYGQTLSVITNELAGDRPILHLEINGAKCGNYESPKLGTILQYTPTLVNTNRRIALYIVNDSEVTAEKTSIDFIADIDPTNVLADQWLLEPKSANGWNHWHLVATDSYGDVQGWYPQAIIISQHFNQPFLMTQFSIHADRSKTWVYPVSFKFQN